MQFRPQSGPSYGAMFGVGMGTAGLMYLMYHARTLNQQRTMPGMHMQQMNYFHPIVQ